MIRKYFLFTLILLLALINNYNVNLYSNKVKLEKFNTYLNNDCLDYNLNNNIVVICFNYDYINEYLKENFNDYKLIKISENEFNLIIQVDRVITNKIKKIYRIEKGELYD